MSIFDDKEATDRGRKDCEYPIDKDLLRFASHLRITAETLALLAVSSPAQTRKNTVAHLEMVSTATQEVLRGLSAQEREMREAAKKVRAFLKAEGVTEEELDDQ